MANIPASTSKPTRPRTAPTGGNAARSLAAEMAFRSRMAEMGAAVLGEYVNANTPVLARCPAGHDCTPRPHDVMRGIGPCNACGLVAGGQARSRAAETVFRERLERLGATLLEPNWLGSGTPHLVQCPAGHRCTPRPSKVREDGRGLCSVCAGRSSAATQERFREALAHFGATLLESRWLGTDTPHAALCREGHSCAPRPNDMLRGFGPCRRCGGKDPGPAEAAFRARLAARGAFLLEPTYLGALTPHLVQCASGHLCRPRPADIQQGHAPCARCAGRGWDVFYVVANARDHLVKFGITGGDGSIRLSRHAQDAFTEVVRLVTGLPETVALDTERAVRAALALADERPLRGREYFDVSCLPLILDVAQGWLAGQGTVITDPADNYTQERIAS